MSEEKLRRLRLSDLQKIMRGRYDKTLPDDDAGREDLEELLLPISLGFEPKRRMANAIEVWADWMPAVERWELIDRLTRTPRHLRKRTARELARRLNVTNAERERWGLRTIRPADMTDREFENYRKARKRAHDRERDRRKRRLAGTKPRESYLAGSLSKAEPWNTEGVCRRTWERRRAKVRVASPSRIKLTDSSETLATVEFVDRPEGAGHESSEEGMKQESKRARTSSDDDSAQSPAEARDLRQAAEARDLSQPSGTMVCNGFAISGNGQNPEDRREPEPGQVFVRVWLQEFRRPPDDRAVAA